MYACVKSVGLVIPGSRHLPANPECCFHKAWVSRGPKGLCMNAVLVDTEMQLLNLIMAFLIIFFLIYTTVRVPMSTVKGARAAATTMKKQ